MPKPEDTRIIYFVEDDEEIRDIVLYALRAAGFEAEGFESGKGLFAALTSNPAGPSLVLLDIMLPENDGLTILKALRSSAQTKSLPVIMLTAKGSEYDKVTGLDMGADDYIVKPFGVLELISRINAVLRRVGAKPAERQLSYHGVTLDVDRRSVTADGQPVKLTYKEFELLHYLMLNSGLVSTRDKIMSAVWGFDFEVESRTLDMHIRTLRKKLGPSGSLIQTVRSVGYRFGE